MNKPQPKTILAIVVTACLASSATTVWAQALTPFTGENPRHWQSGFLIWKRAPQPVPPRGRDLPMEAVLTCEIAQDGGLANCVIESETPPGSGFGRAVISSARRARVDMEHARGPLPLPQAGDAYTFRIWAR